jgi:hypothetical protein
LKTDQIRYLFKRQSICLGLEKRWYREANSIRPFIDEWGFLLFIEKGGKQNGDKGNYDADEV